MPNRGDKKLEHILKIEEYKRKLQGDIAFKRSDLVILASHLEPDYIGRFSDKHPMDTYESAKASRKQRYAQRVLAMIEHQFTLEMVWEGGFFNRWEAHAFFEYIPAANSYSFRQYLRIEDGKTTEIFP
jgi:hypothetical protein